jgi:hypothetical protein
MSFPSSYEEKFLSEIARLRIAFGDTPNQSRTAIMAMAEERANRERPVDPLVPRCPICKMRGGFHNPKAHHIWIPEVYLLDKDWLKKKK